MSVRRWVPAIWLVLMVCGIWYAATRLSIHNDLGDLLPEGSTATQRLLLTQVRTGLSGRLILLALEGAASDELAEASRVLGDTLRADRRFGFVGNGAQAWSKEELSLLSSVRYLLSRTVTADTFSEPSLRNALQQRLDDLRSPLGSMIKESIPGDPTGEVLGILQSWSGWDRPEKYRGVWMSADHTRAVLVVETRAAGFDVDAQEAIQLVIRKAFHHMVQTAHPTVRLLMSGPGVFAVEIQRMIETEAWWLSTAAAVLVLLFLFFSYRSLTLVLLSLIPISSGIVAGMIAVNAWFGFVHGITVGFGITLLGVVDDYPIHLFSHMTTRDSAKAVMRTIWPTMRMGALTTAIGFSSLLLAGYPALAQLGLLALVGILTGAFVTRWVLPACVLPGFKASGIGMDLLSRVDLTGKKTVLVPLVLVVATSAWIWSDTPLWQEDLGSLSPLSEDKKQLDQRLRRELGAPDVRDLLVVEGVTVEDLLQKAEVVMTRLEVLRQDRELAGYDIVSRYVPSHRTQQERQRALPDRAVLERNLEEALKGLPFAPGLFTPFLAAVEAARSQTLVDRDAFAGTMLGMKLESLLFLQQDRWLAAVPLRGVVDRTRLADAVAQWRDGSTSYVDLKEESNRLMTAYRDRTVQLLGWGMAAITIVLGLGLRSIILVGRVLAPILCSLLVVAAVLRGSGEPLSLFHVATFLLVIGLGLDYALFLNRPEGTEEERIRTNFGLLVCSTTTILVFGVLAFSKIPVLHAIGMTAACGALSCLLFAGLLARKEVHIA
ncbi:MAG: MMPL family transporter [Nitrospira sp.]|nr:MMPL family transporter [Nitrospira sp.]MDH4356423.1 MMPL family transporter [Nitrospira sp.]MDH5318795.1 MMPL family transporter [Nitrospira sp.]